MTDQPIKYRVEIKTRKGSKNGSKKVGKIIGLISGKEEEIRVENGSTFTEVTRKLRQSGLIPTSLKINKSGRTEFVPTTLMGGR
ncbi:hypothetical protein HGA34_00970 [Candidatus Falkowbacteria bacterium]|nr:hypothetical protein [Candidatus Falkowbacteria bacterium]